jgi:hypothetical protein
MDDMMGVTPRVRSITAGEPAPPIARDHGATERSGNDGGSPADVKRLGSTRHHHAHHGGVAGKALGDLLSDRPDMVELGTEAGEPEAEVLVEVVTDARPRRLFERSSVPAL